MEGRAEGQESQRALQLAQPIVAVVLLLAAIPRVWAAIGDQGMLWPDEIYQSVEQAHRLAFGYGFVPWEFQDGARSWLFPGVLGLFWKLGMLVGIGSEPVLLLLTRLAMVGLALVGIYASMRIAEAFAGPTAALLAGFLGATFPGSIIYGHRCMSEMASAPILAVAALLCLSSDRRRLFAAGLLASVAVFLRYQNGLVAAGLLVVLLVSPRRRDAIPYAAGAILGGLAGGALDWLTWGRPFHSFFAYLRFNVVEGKSADYGTAPFSYYAETAWTSTGIALVAIVVGTMASWRRAPGLLLVVAVFVIAHSLVGHKEFRFLMPVVPLLLALASMGLVDLSERLSPRAGPRAGEPKPTRKASRTRKVEGRPTAKGVAGMLRGMGLQPLVLAVGLCASVLMLERSSNATLFGIGQPADPDEGRQSVWHHGEGVNISLRKAGEEPDLCGVLLAGPSVVWTGGYTYLHRDVPFLATDVAASELVPFANYVIMPSMFPAPPGYAPLGSIREWTLLRRQGACRPAPPNFARLFER